MKFSGKVRSDHGTTWLHFWSIPRNRAMLPCATRGRGLLWFRTTACFRLIYCHTGVGDGGQGARWENIFSGNHYVKFWHFSRQISWKIGNFVNFSGKYDKKIGHFDNLSGKHHVKFGHFVNFSYIIFGQKCPHPKVDWAPTPCNLLPSVAHNKSQKLCQNTNELWALWCNFRLLLYSVITSKT